MQKNNKKKSLLRAKHKQIIQIMQRTAGDLSPKKISELRKTLPAESQP